jgi:hypothetical protein
VLRPAIVRDAKAPKGAKTAPKGEADALPPEAAGIDRTV